ncbi:hypothetical protein ASF61_16835 [Duganella sp. Leaf126]|nr:hypothetical protein ASF61_16835 [Duganella sp. Leaf126]
MLIIIIAQQPALRHFAHKFATIDHVTHHCFFALLVAAVVGRAESLPVRPIPEQFHVASVRYTVIDYGSDRHAAFAFAIHAQRVLREIAGTGLLPFVAIAARGAALLIRAPRRGLESRERAAQLLHLRLEGLEL